MRALVAAYISAETRGATARTVRSFIGEFAGLSGTGKQKAMLTRLHLANTYLRDLVKDGDVDMDRITVLLDEMQKMSRLVKPRALGVIGHDHLQHWLATYSGATGTVRYRSISGVDESSRLPFIVEAAFAVREGPPQRQVVTGINWSPTLINPFRSLALLGPSLDGLLESLYVSQDAPVIFVLHLACPHLSYSDRGKSTVELL